ncbi:TBC domain containing protein [Cryptosporidium ryanae]|uniref:TBC domain containing protein n=1 Tax=Cryptosporidium ryanae TaxID=515981 RepID=UPI003519E3C5|nr:TBC domain containing protein [Cryptosporidium ryanae]
MVDFEVFEKEEYSVCIEDSDLYQFHEYIKENPLVNFVSYTEEICFKKSGQMQKNKFKDIPRLKWLILLRVIPLNIFNMPFYEYSREIIDLLNRERNEYNISFKKYRPDISKMTSMDPLTSHPLSQSASNPWNEQQKNSELLDEIWKDITRTFSERQLFSEIGTRQLLQRVLFTWTRENPEFGYKQGMNELAAVLFLVNFSQKSKFTNGESQSTEKMEKNNNPITNLIFTGDSIEADTFIMFKSLMSTFGIKYMFQSPDDLQSNEQKLKTDDFKLPIIHRCNNIYSILENIDKELYLHLVKEHGIEPQILFLRWIRLLFSREFSNLNDSLINWELMFCDSLKNGSKYTADNLKMKISALSEQKNEKICLIVESIMPIFNFVAVSILESKRDKILSMDYNQTLKFLVNQSSLTVDPLAIIQNANKLSCFVSNNFLDSNSERKVICKNNGRNNFFDHRDIHYSQIKNNAMISLGNLKGSKVSDSLLEITRNLHTSANNIDDIELLKSTIFSSCKELLLIGKVLKERNI